MAKRPVVALVCLPSDFADELGAYLERRGHEVLTAHESWEAGRLVGDTDVAIAVLGSNLPPDTALDLLRGLDAQSGPSVLMLRPATDLVERVLALEMGAADVVEAPFNTREIAARIGGLLGRRGRQAPELIELENATVDLRSALVMHRSGSEDTLSPGQVALFRLFVENPRKVLTRDDIMAEAPAETLDAFDRSIDSRIVRLRRKLDTERIVTIRGSGYRYDPPASSS